MSAELNKAYLYGDVTTVQACLARGVDINAESFGYTPLIAAVTYNNLEIVRILLARDDLDIAATNSYGNTALHVACMNGSAECVTLLGQDRRMTSSIINIKCNVGNTALMWAVINYKKKFLHELVKHERVSLDLREGAFDGR